MSENKKNIASISISGEITLNLHSLNNEGGEGNQIITRQVTIVDKYGEIHTVNAISGDMFKHIHAGHLVNYSQEKKLTTCEGCKVFDPNRISVDSTFLSILKGIDSDEFEDVDKERYIELEKVLSELEDSSKEYKEAQKEKAVIEKKYIILKITDESDKVYYQQILKLIDEKLPKKGTIDYEEKKKKQDEAKKGKKDTEKKYSLDFSNAEKTDKILEMCSVDDIHGVLITAEKNNLPRKSLIEFGWTVGLPNKTNTESYLHTKIVADAGAKGSADGGNTGQNIFHRPANHGVYAFICSIDVYRIGFNDISRDYPVNNEVRSSRYKALVQSLLSSFINPKGAMTSTQKPHITDFKGIVSVSSKLLPAPTISAINENYLEEIQTIANNLNRIEDGAISLYKFNGLGDLSGIMADLIEYEPYKIS